MVILLSNKSLGDKRLYDMGNTDNLNQLDNFTVATALEVKESYESIIKWLQFAMTLIGLIGNSVAYITLYKNGNTFTNPTMLRLLKNQSLLDTIVCFIGGIFVLQPPMWRAGGDVLSNFICMVSS